MCHFHLPKQVHVSVDEMYSKSMCVCGCICGVGVGEMGGQTSQKLATTDDIVVFVDSIGFKVASV